MIMRKNHIKVNIAVLLILCIGVLSGCSESNSVLYEDRGMPTKVDTVIQQANCDEALRRTIDNGYLFEDPFVAINPYGYSPLTALICFNTEEAVTAKVTIKGKSKDADIVYTFDATTNHILPIYGLYSGYANTVKIKLSDGRENEINIRTQKIVSVKATIDVGNVSLKKNQLICFPQKNSVEQAIRAYDKHGDLRWVLQYDNLMTNTMFYAGNSRYIVPSDELHELPHALSGYRVIDLMGKVYEQTIMQNGFKGKIDEKLDNTNIIELYADGAGYDLTAPKIIEGGYKEEEFEESEMSVEQATKGSFKFSAIQKNYRIEYQGKFAKYDGPESPNSTRIAIYSRKEDKLFTIPMKLGDGIHKVDTYKREIVFDSWFSTEGLEGAYDIYVIIDGHLYDTDISFTK